MSAIEDLKNVVADLAGAVSADADEVSVAIDLLREVIAANQEMPAGDDPAVIEAVAKLVELQAKLSDTTRVLKEEVDSVSVSGGVVYPRE